MKSILSGSAVAVSYLILLGGTVAAQYPAQYPSTDPSQLRRLPQGQPVSHFSPHTYTSTSPVITPAEPQQTPNYSSYNNNLSNMLGTPPVGSAAPEPIDATQPYRHGVDRQPTPYGDVTPIGAGALSCGGCGRCADCGGCGNWFAGVSGLLMKPDRENPYFFSYDRANEAIQLTNNQDAEIQWGGGWDVRFGRYFNCGSNALEVVYWGLFPDTESTWNTNDDVASGNLDAILNFVDLTYNGVAANTLTDGAQVHQLWHEQEYHNVEVNLVSFGDSCGIGGCSKGACGGKCGRGSRLRNRCLLGFRWFKFHDNLLFGADNVDRVFTGAVNEVYYNIDLDNDLIGFQLGCEGEYCLSKRLTFDYGIKMGIYGNDISHQSDIGGAAGVAVINNGPNTGVQFLVRNSKDDVAFMGEANVGLEYQFGRCWTATAGYRALSVAGVALPTNQIWPDVRGIQDVYQIDSNGSLILHGGYFGVEYNF